MIDTMSNNKSAKKIYRNPIGQYELPKVKLVVLGTKKESQLVVRFSKIDEQHESCSATDI